MGVTQGIIDCAVRMRVPAKPLRGVVRALAFLESPPEHAHDQAWEVEPSTQEEALPAIWTAEEAEPSKFS